MKKLFIIFIMLVYGLSSSGISVNLHYCRGKLGDISFSLPLKEDKCDNNHCFSSHKRCCVNKQIEFKLKSDQEASAKWSSAFKQIATPAIISQAFCYGQPQQHLLINERSTGPPLFASFPPIFIKNCIFRI